jgi:hypothetical protein
MSPHAVRHFCQPVVAETVSKDVDCEENGVADGATNFEVESDVDVDVDPVVERVDVDPVLENINDTPNIETCFDFNLLLPEKDFFKFVLENFECRKCHARISERCFKTDRVGFATSLFWACSSLRCTTEASILAKASTKESSGTFRRKHPELPWALGDYDINRHVVLACQQSGGGS